MTVQSILDLIDAGLGGSLTAGDPIDQESCCRDGCRRRPVGDFGFCGPCQEWLDSDGTIVDPIDVAPDDLAAVAPVCEVGGCGTPARFLVWIQRPPFAACETHAEQAAGKAYRVTEPVDGSWRRAVAADWDTESWPAYLDKVGG